jgi:hypothetical protein
MSTKFLDFTSFGLPVEFAVCEQQTAANNTKMGASVLN